MEHPAQVDIPAPGAISVVLTGAVILVRHDEVLPQVEQAMKAEPATRIAVDLSEVTSLDSSGVALLLLLRRRASRAGAAFRLHGARPEVRRHLRLAGLTTLFRLAAADEVAHPGDGNVAAPARADDRPSAAVEILDQPFELDDIRTVRHRLSSYAGSIGMTEMEGYKLVLATTEVMANSVRHGGGRGHIRVCSQRHHLIVEVSDSGPGIPRRYLEQRPRPRPGRIGLSGLWVVRQTCERVDIDTGPDGTVVRLIIDLPR